MEIRKGKQSVVIEIGTLKHNLCLNSRLYELNHSHSVVHKLL